MAIDTPARRYSILNFGGSPDIVLPTPDGGIEQEDRQHFLDLYGGILAGEAVVVVPVVSTTPHGAYKKFRLRSEDELKVAAMNEVGPKGFVLNRRIFSERSDKYDPSVIYSEFRKKIDNR